MSESIDPHNASVDSLIEWLGEQRRRDPASPLSTLLGDQRMDPQRLVDLACVDLMQRRRMAQSINVEHYIEDFPSLKSEANLLDLIDAELCIAVELKQSVDVEDYVRRFPHVADQVRELIQLDQIPQRPAAPGLIDVGVSADACSRSIDFSVDVASSESRPREIISGVQHPLDTPEWFVGELCVASSPGRWLIRGRDSARGIALALKIIALPAQLTSNQSRQLVDACQQGAKVTHPSWVAPRVAAIQRCHLGVIRPWVFARPWDTDVSASNDMAAAGEIAGKNQQAQLRRFASVAFALAAAHQVGASHGGIQSENLVIDHENVVRLIDAGSSRSGLRRWLRADRSTTGDDDFASLAKRQRMDAYDLIKLVAGAAVGWEQEIANDLVAELQRLEKQHPEQGCAMMGQSLMRWSDKLVLPSSNQSQRCTPRNHSWRKRLAKWLIKET